MKKITILLFVFITIILIGYVNGVFVHKQSGYNINELTKEDEIDILFTGASSTEFSISPMYIYDKYKIKSYTAASQGANSLISYYNIIYLNKFHPKIVVYDIIYLAVSRELFHHLDISYMNSYNDYFLKYNLLKDVRKYMPEKYSNISIDDMNILYLYHDRWKSLNQYDFTSNYYLRGHYTNFQPIYNIITKDSIKDIKTNNIILQDRVKLITEKIKEYTDKHQIKLIMIGMPYRYKLYEDYTKAFEKIAEELNITYINFNNLNDVLQLDYNTSFMDDTHLNYVGSKKIMDYLMTYIIDNYGDYLNRTSSEKWDKEYKLYDRTVNLYKIKALKSFQEWQNLAYYDNYTMLISTNGDNVLNRLPQDMKDKFKTLGLNKFETNKNNQKYVAIIDNGKVFFEEISDKKVEYKGRMKNKVNLLVSSENKQATINVSGKPRSKNKYGINFVIYDKVNREIVDSIWLDPSNFNQVRR